MGAEKEGRLEALGDPAACGVPGQHHARLAAVLPRLQGAFSTVVMTKDRVLAFRDPEQRALAAPYLRDPGAVSRLRTWSLLAGEYLKLIGAWAGLTRLRAAALEPGR